MSRGWGLISDKALIFTHLIQSSIAKQSFLSVISGFTAEEDADVGLRLFVTSKMKIFALEAEH